MDSSAVYAFVVLARDCASAMRDNANYVRAELPEVEMTDALRVQAEEVCSSLLDSEREVMAELAELANLLDAGTSTAVIRDRVGRIVRLCRDDMDRVDLLVEALHDPSEQVGEYVLAAVLVTESATNILNAFNRAKSSAELLGVDIPGGLTGSNDQ